MNKTKKVAAVVLGAVAVITIVVLIAWKPRGAGDKSAPVAVQIPTTKDGGTPKPQAEKINVSAKADPDQLFHTDWEDGYHLGKLAGESDQLSRELNRGTTVGGRIKIANGFDFMEFVKAAGAAHVPRGGWDRADEARAYFEKGFAKGYQEGCNAKYGRRF